MPPPLLAGLVIGVTGASLVSSASAGPKSVSPMHKQAVAGAAASASTTVRVRRADLVDVHGDGGSHVVAVHQASAVRNGRKRVSRGSIVFTFLGDKATGLLELYGDLPGDDAFFS